MFPWNWWRARLKPKLWLKRIWCYKAQLIGHPHIYIYIYRGLWKPLLPLFFVKTFCSEVFLQKWVVRKWWKPFVRCGTPPKSKNNQQGFIKIRGKHIKMQPTTHPRGRRLGCCLHLHVLPTYFDKSRLIILTFWWRSTANERFSQFSDHPFLQEYLRTKGFHKKYRFS